IVPNMSSNCFFLFFLYISFHNPCIQFDIFLTFYFYQFFHFCGSSFSRIITAATVSPSPVATFLYSGILQYPGQLHLQIHRNFEVLKFFFLVFFMWIFSQTMFFHP
ncbi:hypothetical protein L9F63_017433, partial [Diploptera punctata]